MADTPVLITGSKDGSLTNALSGLPPWATQEAAEDIVSWLQKSYDIHNKTLTAILKQAATNPGGTLSPEELKKVNDELEILGKDLKESNEQQNRAKTLRKQDEKNQVDKINRQKQEKVNDAALSKVLAGLTAIGTKTLNVQKQYYATSNDLFKSGVNLLAGNNTTTSSMMSLNQMVSLTGIRLENLQKIIDQNAMSINAIGVTKFTKSLAASSSKLTSLGYNFEDAGELVGTLIESETSYSNIRGKSTEQIANEAIKLGEDFTRMSLTLGMSRKELENNMKALSQNSNSLVVASSLGADATKKLNTSLSGIADDSLRSSIQGLAASMAAGTQNNNEFFKTLNATGNATFGLQLQEAIKYAEASGDAVGAQKRLTAAASALTSEQIKNLQVLKDSGGAAAGPAAATLDTIARLQSQANKTSDATKDQTDAAIKNQASLAAFDNALEKTRSLAQQAFPLLETQVDLATEGLKRFNSVIDSVINMFDVNMRSWIGIIISVVGAISGVILEFRTLMGTLKWMSEAGGPIGKVASAFEGVVGRVLGWLNPIGKIAAAFAAGYAIGTFIYKIIEDMSWFTNQMDHIFNGLDHILQYIPGATGSDAKERIATREAAIAIGNQNQEKRVAVTKNPAPSTVNSPSATSPTPKNTTEPNAPSAPVPVASGSTGSGIEKPSSSADINSLIAHQNAVLEQILIGTRDLVSVNKDILTTSRRNL